MADFVHAVRESLETTGLLPPDTPDSLANYEKAWQVIHELQARGWTVRREWPRT